MNALSSRLPAGRVLPIAFTALLVPIACLEYSVLQYTHGVFSYGLDDTFIHLAIAKNLALHGIWGTSPHEFASASSSILYPLMIAGLIKLMGTNAIIPFIINLLAAVALLVTVRNWLKRHGIPALGQLVILLAVIFITPLPVMVMIGMEHTLQLLFCFLFVYSFSDALSGESVPPGKKWGLPWQVPLYGALMVATRYECSILILVAAIILLIRKKIEPAFQLTLFSFLPVLLFGFYSLYQGSYFMPNSVLLKSQAPHLTFPGLYDFFTSQLYERLVLSQYGYIYNTVSPQRLVLILPITYLLFIRHIQNNSSYIYILILLTAGVLAHLSFAVTARSPRFEAYLIGNSVIIIFFLFVKYGPAPWRQWTKGIRWAFIFVATMLFFPLLLRSIQAFTEIRQSCCDIFNQQYQMGSFFHKYYNNDPVALNDIGAVSYLTEGKNLDLIGLSNLDVAKSRLEYYYGARFLDAVIRKEKVRVAVVYNFWFSPELLGKWSPVADWVMKDNVICADRKVTFYAIDTTIKQELRSKLAAYESSLPRDVKAYYY